MDIPPNTPATGDLPGPSLALPPGGFPSVPSTLGALLLGTFANTVLYGIGFHQTYRYFRLSYAADTLSIRVIVILLFILETLLSVFSMHTNYHFLVTDYFNPLDTANVLWTKNMIPITGILITLTSQYFFLRRVSIISPTYKLVSGIAALFLVYALACNILLTYYSFQPGGFSIDFFVGHRWIMSTAYGALTVMSSLITGSLFMVLRHSRQDPNRSDSLSDRIIIYGINTGVLVLIIDLLTMIMAAARPDTLYWVPFALISDSLYMNTLLSVLNSRTLFLARGIEIFDGGHLGAHIMSRAKRMATVERWNVPQLPEEVPPTLVDIKVTTEVEDEGRGFGTISSATQDEGKIGAV